MTTPGRLAPRVQIGPRLVGPGQACYVIAEAGVNHNGSMPLAREIVMQAQRAGADCVKFQTFKADRVATAAAPKAGYQLRSTDPAESQVDMLRKLELQTHDFVELRALCDREGIAFLSTPYNPEDVEMLAALDVEAYKIPSALIVEPGLLQLVARHGRPVLLSTGMATLEEVDAAVSAITSTGNRQLVLLQCTTDYPSAVADANLRAMKTMAERFNVPVGYSDHTQSPVPSLVAVGLGASVIEKHFTLDHSMSGPDHSTSADPREFAALVRMIREAEAALGRAEKGPTDLERANMAGMRRSVVARRPIAAGVVITEEMLTCKRPATGIPPNRLSDVVGRIARVAIDADQLLEWSMLE